MSRKILKPALDIAPLTQNIPVGGTKAIKAVPAANNLGLITNDKLGANTGVAILDSNSKIPSTVIPGTITGGYKTTIKGSTNVVVGTSTSIYITNYDADSTYTVSTTGGYVEIQDDVVTYKAPDTVGIYDIHVNDAVISISVQENYILKPTITSPVNLSTGVQNFVNLASSPYSLYGPMEIAQLTASDAQASDIYGITCALNAAGTRLVVGAASEDTAAIDAGKVYIYDYNGTNWVEVAQLTASDAQAIDTYGFSCALNAAGTRLVVGAQLEDTAGTDAGKVYIYDFNGTNWIEAAQLTASDAQAADYYGRSCALNAAGDRLVVGAAAEDTAGTNAGKVYIYDYNGTNWIEAAQLTASDAQVNDWYGESCSLSSAGDRLVVGAYLEDTAGTDAGKVYIYDFNGTNWVEVAQLTASDAQAGDSYGGSCSLNALGDRLAVGAQLEDTAGADAGKIYIYDYNGTNWVEVAQLTASDAQAGDSYGGSCSLNALGDRLAVGAYLEDTAATDAGKVYIYRPSWHLTSDWQLSTDPTFTTVDFEALAVEGDLRLTHYFEGLALNTVYYARVRYNGSQFGNSGWSDAISFTTEATSLPTSEVYQLTASDAQAGDIFGASCALNAAGDRLVVGSAYEDTAATDAGKVYVYDFDGINWIETAQLTASDAQANDVYGVSCSLDGVGDRLVVGAYLEDTAAPDAGKVYIYDFNGTNWIEVAQLTASDAQAGDYYGRAVAFNAVGDRLVVGAYLEDTAGTDAGKIYIYDYNGTNWVEVAQLTASDAQVSDYYGISCALNAAGTRLVVGAAIEDTAATDAGKVYVYDYNGTNWVEVAQLTASDAQVNDRYGLSCSLNSAGTRLAVGAYLEDTAAPDAGKVYIYDFNGTNWVEVAQLTASDAQASDWYGVSCVFNALGDKLAVGAFYEDTAATDAGKVYIYH